jgi:hypothetical protein
MHEELIKNIRSIKQRLGAGIITTLNGTDHYLMNQLDWMEEIVNKNFGLADVSDTLLQNEAIDFVMWCKSHREFVYEYECNRHYNEILYTKFKEITANIPQISESKDFENGFLI